MKLICTALVSGTMLCLSLVSPAMAGPGGTYGYGTGYGTGGYGQGGYGQSGYGQNTYGPVAPTTYPTTYPTNGGYVGPRPYPTYNAGTTGSYRPVSTYNTNDYGYQGAGFGGGFNQPSTVIYNPNVNVRPNNMLPPTTINQPYYDRPVNETLNPNITNGQGYGNNNFINGNNRIYVAHRPSYYDSGWYHGDWNSRNRKSKYNPYAWGGWNWGNGKPTGANASSPWQYGYWGYNNPYYVRNARGPGNINYSQPIVANNMTVDASGFAPQVVGQMPRQQALQIFSTARAAFFAGDLDDAQAQVEQAIAALPGDTVLHEFRSLVLFAKGDYSSAAGGIYAVLSSGPGWNWTTMIGLYPNSNIYTAQLRNLENFCNGNPNAANARFVLAYHYMTAGYADAATEMYRQVLATNPQDTLSAQLLSSLTGQAWNNGQQVAQLQPIDQSVDIRYLIGNWQATRIDGSQFNLSLSRDGTYDWQFAQGGRTQQFNGTYTIADSVLVLQQNGQPAMVGQVIPLAGNRFVFKLTGGDPSDPGLNFVR
ncbi:MAG: hypothetical protein JWN70_4669 [Planctomycetaceae bacterium]|nr:hypothetical protein [Planctomycetaceae bacterium]